MFSWCIENYVVLRQLRRRDVHLLFYESLLAEPEGELDRLFGFLGKKYDGRVWKIYRKPSFTVLRRQTQGARALANRWLDGWRSDVSQEQVERCLEILALFGLDAVYGACSQPNMSGALDMMRP